MVFVMSLGMSYSLLNNVRFLLRLSESLALLPGISHPTASKRNLYLRTSIHLVENIIIKAVKPTLSHVIPY